MSHIAIVLIALAWTNGNSFAKKLPKLSTRLYPDSTIFSLQLVKGSKPEVGKTFKVKIHVDVHPGWHVWSSTMADDGGLIPLGMRIPDSIFDFFQIISLKEHSEIVDRYDSNFLVETKGIYQPFDLIATIEVKKGAPSVTPFSLIIEYQALNSKSCMPPMTVAVLMQFLSHKPLTLKIAAGKKHRKQVNNSI